MTASRPEPGWNHRWIDLAGLRTYVRISLDGGEATPVLHLHGFGISGNYLMPTARLLVDRGVQVVPDLPGYGRSEKPRRPLSIPGLADAAVAVLDTLGIERAVLVGNSMGCPISLEVANRYPDRVEALVLVSPAGGAANQPLGRAVGQLARDATRENRRMATVAVPDYLRFGPVNTLRLFQEMTRFPALDRLIGIHVPALAVLGDRDPLLPGPERIRAVARLMPPNVTVVKIEGAAHALNFSHPGELAHVIRSWRDGVAIDDDPTQPGLATVIQLPRE